MALTSFVSRLRNGSSTFNKDQGSTSTVSLHIQPDGAVQRPATASGAPPDFPTGNELWHADQFEQHELVQNPNIQIIGKNQGASIKKRFFSRSGAPKLPIPLPSAAGALSALSSADKLGLLRLPTGSHKIDMVTVLKAIEERFADEFEKDAIEPLLQLGRTFEKQCEQYQWCEPGTTNPSYPPCLKHIPLWEITGPLAIFDLNRTIDTFVATLPVGKVPKLISQFLFGDPIGETMAETEARMKALTRRGKNIGSVASIANRPDWFTDSVFSQQSFTGPNPTTIARASTEWIQRFTDTANIQENKAAYRHLSTAAPESIYIQDYSYFRNAVGAAPDSTLSSEDGTRFGCAAVTLHQLSNDGRLHPLAIVLDYKVSMENSVVLFNRRLSPDDSSAQEATDWPWRFAKLCNQVSDWTRHECAIHLNDCHLIEEATIVAACRSFPSDHVVYNLLQPHWLKTLSLNAAARKALVPDFINKINGFTPTQTYNFILDAYQRFNWTAHYIPTDLSRRGFTPSVVSGPTAHNYVWAKNMSLMWPVLQKFVSSMLSTVYTTDEQVLHDPAVQKWCSEMHSPTGGQMASFPDIQTRADLIDAVTMCIHIASPQHNSVNYLQCYYMSFVPNKPGSLAKALPNTLRELMTYGEKDMMAALPTNNSQVWLMSSQLPYLLSYSVLEDETLVAYAQRLEADAQLKRGEKWEKVEAAAKTFVDDLLDLGVVFQKNSEGMDDRIVPYNVMSPDELAVSVLI